MAELNLNQIIDKLIEEFAGDARKREILLERQDTDCNYLIYAPFPKPPVEENHLEDTLLYSKRFYADRVSLISVDLGIQEKYKPGNNMVFLDS